MWIELAGDPRQQDHPPYYQRPLQPLDGFHHHHHYHYYHPHHHYHPLQPLDGSHPTITIIVVIVFLANVSLLTSFSSDTIGTRVFPETLWSNRWLEASSEEVQPGRRGLGDWKIVIPQLFLVKIEWIGDDGELGRWTSEQRNEVNLILATWYISS